MLKLLLVLVFSLSSPAWGAEKVVVTSPAVVELLYSLGVGEKIIGATEFSDYPEAAKKIPRIGSYARPSLEKIISLKPDLVILTDEGTDTISDSLKKANISLVVLRLKSLNDFASTLSALTDLFKVDTSKVLKEWKQSWEKVKPTKSQKTVFIQVDHNPIFASGKKTFLAEIVEKCGLKNSLDNFEGFKQISLEQVARAKADIVLVTAQEKSATLHKEINLFWSQQPLQPKPQVVFFDPSLLTRMTLRLPKAAAELCEKLQQ